jgi:PadR family transcriptional regulator, regulatory protein PadR
MNMNLENTKAQMRKGVLEYCILSILANNDAYASDIINELKEAKMIVVEGHLYPLLTRQKNAGSVELPLGRVPAGPAQEILYPDRKGKSFSG